MTKESDYPIETMPGQTLVDNGDGTHTIDPGRYVYCDYCGEDYTQRPDEGGLLFQSKAACPACSPRIYKNALKFDEQRFIRDRCPAKTSFADWVRSIR